MVNILALKLFKDFILMFQEGGSFPPITNEY